MSIELKVPAVGESIVTVEIGKWLKAEGEEVRRGDPVVVLETEKTTVDLPSPEDGRITRILKRERESASIGEVIGYLEKGTVPLEKTAEVQETKPEPREATQGASPSAGEPRVMPSARRVLEERGLKAEDIQGTGPGGRILKEDALRHAGEAPKGTPLEPETARPAPPATEGGRERREEIVPMSLLRRRVAERLVQAQQTAALLTTFNEIDMSEVIGLRQRHQDAFRKKYGVKLGFMSFFVKAAVDALKQFPVLNAEIRGTDIVYRNYHDMGIAVASERGLVVPVLFHVDRMSFAEVELAIDDLAQRARAQRLKVEELQGGTFTISNGGIYGSLLSTPIVNPPQSGILGMHAIQERPVVHQGGIVIRPMMYVALTYDHRLVDGREAVLFLKRIQEAIENPARMLIEI